MKPRKAGLLMVRFGWLVVMAIWPIFSAANLVGDTRESEQKDRDAVAQAKDTEGRLKAYLDLAETRLKTLLLAARKLDKDGSETASEGFRTAVTSAEDCIAKDQADKNYKKLVTQLHKAMQKYNFALLHALDKAAEDFRKYIQSAYEVSQRVQDGTEIQLAHYK